MPHVLERLKPRKESARRSVAHGRLWTLDGECGVDDQGAGKRISIAWPSLESKTLSLRASGHRQRHEPPSSGLKTLASCPDLIYDTISSPFWLLGGPVESVTPNPRSPQSPPLAPQPRSPLKGLRGRRMLALKTEATTDCSTYTLFYAPVSHKHIPEFGLDDI